MNKKKIEKIEIEKAILEMYPSYKILLEAWVGKKLTDTEVGSISGTFYLHLYKKENGLK